jgi:hypothetical protein
MPFTDPRENEVWAFVRKLNDAWTREKGGRLGEFFHPRMVAITPVEKFGSPPSRHD